MHIQDKKPCNRAPGKRNQHVLCLKSTWNLSPNTKQLQNQYLLSETESRLFLLYSSCRFETWQLTVSKPIADLKDASLPGTT
eukprot:c8883_g1_i1 orf=368-613(-)